MDELLKYLNALPASERDGFAERCGTTVAYLRKACSVGQRLGEGICINIDRESGKRITCEMLRPDVDWKYLRNSEPSVPVAQAERAQAATQTIAPSWNGVDRRSLVKQHLDPQGRREVDRPDGFPAIEGE
jgi:DNA-binding transcriptional regulator YdaS (Cro superfamily)